MKDGFEEGKINESVFMELTVAYGTISRGLLLRKVYELCKDYGMTQIIRDILRNKKRFLLNFQEQEVKEEFKVQITVE